MAWHHRQKNSFRQGLGPNRAAKGLGYISLSTGPKTCVLLRGRIKPAPPNPSPTSHTPSFAFPAHRDGGESGSLVPRRRYLQAAAPSLPRPQAAAARSARWVTAEDPPLPRRCGRKRRRVLLGWRRRQFRHARLVSTSSRATPTLLEC